MTPDHASDMSLLPSKLSTVTHGFPGFKSPQLINTNNNRFRFKDDDEEIGLASSRYIESSKNSPQGLNEIVKNVTQSQFIPRMKLNEGGNLMDKRSYSNSSNDDLMSDGSLNEIREKDGSDGDDDDFESEDFESERLSTP